MLTRLLRLGGLGLTAGVLLVSACGGGGDSDAGASCEQGDERCECYPNETCNDDLECRSGVCVSLGSGGSSNGSGGSDSNSGSGGSFSGAGGTSSGAGGTSSSSNGAGGSSSGAGGSSSSSGGSSSSTNGSSTTGGPPSTSPVATHGQLTLDGQQIVDEDGKAVQLKGVSSMWLNWEPTGYAESLAGLKWMRDNWNVSLIRAAMGVDAEGAYLEDPDTATRQVTTIIENAIEAGVYVLVDWHDHEAHLHQSEAEAFFDELSAKYGDEPNVLYELFNEPLDISWASDLKPYHQAVSGVIRDNDPDNIIILGTPNWSQDVDIAAQSPVSGSNLMYTLHFYSCSHGSALRSKATAAYNAGLPLFVTEWGATDADGGVDGLVCEPEAQAWHDWMDPRGISWAAWKLDGCTDSTCFFKDRDVPVAGDWQSSDLNGHAPFVIERLLAENPYLDDEVVDPGTCQQTGTCAEGDGMDCDVDDQPIERDCSGCALLDCGVDCCGYIGYFGADTVPDFLTRQDLITGFTQSGSQASLEVSFDGPSQLAALVFRLDQTYAIDPGYVTVSVDASGAGVVPELDISVSLEDGDAGCVYPLYYYSGTTAFLDEAYANCWGGFTTSSAASQVNVRLTSYSSGSAELAVYDVSF